MDTLSSAACAASPTTDRSAMLLTRFMSVRSTSRALAADLSPEDCQVQSMPDASPVKWHLAHTTWFFETFILCAFDDAYRPFSEPFRVLFNSYYNAVGEKHPRPHRGLLTRPSLDDVLAYRTHVDAAMADLISRAPGRDPALQNLLELGLHHEQQHQELILTDVKHLLSCNPLKPAYRSHVPREDVRAVGLLPGWTSFDGGIVRIGHDADGFAFDNESPAHDILLQPYQLANRLVTQDEYLAFMQDGGYRRPELWLSEGWDVVNREGLQAPMYWEGAGDDWHAFTLFGMEDLDPLAPVAHISYFEADAFARWAGGRLPREGEWEWAARCQPGAATAPQANLLESGFLHPRPAVAQAGSTGPGQLFGDVWEWTSSSYEPYPGFVAATGAVGEYNGKFMCNQYVLRGGSCITSRSHVRATYRNFFPTAVRWQFSGLRLARAA